MKMPFYKMDSERVHVSITAILENGKLSLDGFDYGKYSEGRKILIIRSRLMKKIPASSLP